MSTGVHIQTAPYAPPSSVMQMITRHRERGLPDPLTKASLSLLGIPSSSAARTLKSLKFLGLLDEGGHPSELFDRLKRTPNGEYKSIFADLIRNAYSSVFSFVDPVQDDLGSINDAFRQFEPAAQRDRMINLFLTLCSEADIISEEKRSKVASTRPSSQSLPKKSQDRKVEEQRTVTKSREQATSSNGVPHREREVEETLPDYRLMAVLLQQLPKDRRWTKRQRDQWLQAMTANIDLLLEVNDEMKQVNPVTN